MNDPFAFSDPESALLSLADQLKVIADHESVSNPLGRVLAAPILADRNSPAADVSAMDGYAIKLNDLKTDVDIPVSDQCQPGQRPPEMTPGHAIRIFTGAVIPAGCQAVVKREDTIESADSIRFLPTTLDSTDLGCHIRRSGENVSAGDLVLSAGVLVNSAVTAALANFGVIAADVFRKVRIGVLTTGNEVLDPKATDPAPWQLRNSNAVAIKSILSSLDFVEVNFEQHLSDDRRSLAAALEQSFARCDVTLMTGGVSKGDYDFVPDVIAEQGADVVFHGLPIRPGKPILGAVGRRGELVLGLPGNPVSATVNCHRFAIPLIGKIAGLSRWMRLATFVTLDAPPRRPIPLHGMFLARMTGQGTATLVAAKGSGDLVAMSRSDGYVCLPPNADSTGPWPIFLW